jgi:hypothetical protein
MLVARVLAGRWAHHVYTVGGLTCQVSIAHAYGQKRSPYRWFGDLYLPLPLHFMKAR